MTYIYKNIKEVKIMKKIILMMVIFLSVLTLTACVNTPNDDKEISELEKRIESLEQSLIDNQNILNEVQDALDEANNNIEDYQLLEETLRLELQEALLEIEQAQDLIDNLYDQLFELTGVDQRLLSVVQEQKEAIMNLGVEEEILVNSSFNGGSGVFGQILSGPKYYPLSQVSPFQYDEEWQEIQIRYYQMLEEVIQQGYGQGEIVSINKFTFQEPLSYYGIDTVLNQEYFLEINLDGNETLFSRVLTYDDITLNEAKIVKSKTISAKFVNEKLELVLLIQDFDEDEVMSSFLLEDFKEDLGLVRVQFGKDIPLYVSYYVGLNIREDLNAIFFIDYAYGGVVTSERYDLTYIDNGMATDIVTIRNLITNIIGLYNSTQSYLLNNKIDGEYIDVILGYYASISDEEYMPSDADITPNDIYSIGDAYRLSLDLEYIDPLMSLYEKLLKVDDYLNFTGELSSTQKAEFDSLVQQLDNYEYNGSFYDFINYDESTETYSLIDAMDTLPLSIVNSDGYMKIYNSYLKYKNLMDIENKTLDQYFDMYNYISDLRPIYEFGNLDIYTITYGEGIILSSNIPVVYNLDVTEYNDDLIYLMSNHNLFLDIFTPYYNSTPEDIINLLEAGLFYNPLNVE
jgi:hypothetical protein